jgi:hypothetical protein
MCSAPSSELKCQEALARVVGKMHGDDSPAGVALAQFSERRAAGEDVILFPLRGKWLIGTATDIKAESDRLGAISRERAALSQRASLARSGRVMTMASGGVVRAKTR